MIVTCESCHKRLNVPDTTCGKEIRCPSCQGIVDVPEAILVEEVEDPSEEDQLAVQWDEPETPATAAAGSHQEPVSGGLLDNPFASLGPDKKRFNPREWFSPAIAVIVVLVGGYFAYTHFTGPADTDETETATKSKTRSERGGNRNRATNRKKTMVEVRAAGTNSPPAEAGSADKEDEATKTAPDSAVPKAKPKPQPPAVVTAEAKPKSVSEVTSSSAKPEPNKPAAAVQKPAAPKAAATRVLDRKEIVALGKKAVALVEVRGNTHSYGSAFCIDPSGLFVTSEHVIREEGGGGRARIRVVLNSGADDQKVYRATVEYTDRKHDLAILKVDSQESFPVIGLSGLKGMQETDMVYVIGFPLGLALKTKTQTYPSPSVSVGRVTSLRRSDGELTLVQFDGEVNPGNSGGPVIDSYGNVVGVVAFKYTTTNLNFAVPVHYVETLRRRPPAGRIAATKHPVPSKDEQAPAFSKVKEAFAPQYAAARKAKKPIAGIEEQRFKLALELLKQAMEARETPARFYVLLSEAHKMAVDAGAPLTTTRALSLMDDHFETDALSLLASSLRKITSSRTTTGQAQGIIVSYASLAMEYARRDQYADTSRALKAAQRYARRLKDPYLVSRVGSLQKFVDAIRAENTRLGKIWDQLAQNPDDAELNLRAGRFLAFYKKDWEAGLAHLAKSSDAVLKALAAKDLEDRPGTTAVMDVADQWWKLADSQTDKIIKDACRERAVFWYIDALDRLEGLDKKTALTHIRTGFIDQVNRGDWVDLLDLAQEDNPEDAEAARASAARYANEEDTSGEIFHSRRGFVVFPIGMVGSYQAQVTFKPLHRYSLLSLMVPVGPKHVQVQLKNAHTLTAPISLYSVNGERVYPKNKVDYWQPGWRYRVDIQVKVRGGVASLGVFVDGKTALFWQGRISKLSPGRVRAPPQGAMAAYGSSGNVRIYMIMLQMTGGKARILD